VPGYLSADNYRDPNLVDIADLRITGYNASAGIAVLVVARENPA